MFLIVAPFKLLVFIILVVSAKPNANPLLLVVSALYQLNLFIVLLAPNVCQEVTNQGVLLLFSFTGALTPLPVITEKSTFSWPKIPGISLISTSFTIKPITELLLVRLCVNVNLSVAPLNQLGIQLGNIGDVLKLTWISFAPTKPLTGISIPLPISANPEAFKNELISSEDIFWFINKDQLGFPFGAFTFFSFKFMSGNPFTKLKSLMVINSWSKAKFPVISLEASFKIAVISQL